MGGGSVSEIGAIIDAVKAAAELIGDAISTLNGARSVVVEVDNNTDITLSMLSSNHDHGGFSSAVPHGNIPPKSAEVFGSQSSAWSVGTGTEGSVTYEGDQFSFYIHWDNPFIGSNECGSFLLGPKGNLFQSMSICGSGNEDAHMRFVVSPSTRAFGIANRQTGKVLDVPGYATEDHVVIQQYTPDWKENQQWLLHPIADGGNIYYVIENRYSQRVLDVPGFATGDGVQIQQYGRNNGHNQQWRLKTMPGGFFPLAGSYFKIINRHTGKVLDVPDGAPEDGVQIQQYHDVYGGFNQQWNLVLL